VGIEEDGFKRLNRAFLLEAAQVTYKLVEVLPAQFFAAGNGPVPTKQYGVRSHFASPFEVGAILQESPTWTAMAAHYRPLAPGMQWTRPIGMAKSEGDNPRLQLAVEERGRYFVLVAQALPAVRAWGSSASPIC
jgi:hypothetical protein